MTVTRTRPPVHVRTLPCLLVSGGLGLVCFLYRYLSYDGFTNDHYVNLSRAQQILLGDVPVRDFVDPGLPLMYYASAAFQLAFGRTALSDAVLVFGALTVAAGITCWMAVKLTGSYLVASVATLFQILVLPRSYGYPKILLYALALLAVASYARSPGLPRAALLGGLTAVAFLTRHDHGVFIGVACSVAIVLVEFRRGFSKAGRALAVYAVATIVLLIPYLVLIESTVGFVAYVLDGIAFSRAEAARSSLDHFPAFALHLDATSAATNAQAWLFFLPWGLSAAALIRLFLARDATAAAMVVTAVFLSMLTAATFLRSPLSVRLADIWGALPITLAYALHLPPQTPGRRWLRASGGVAAALVLGFTAFSVGVVGRVRDTFPATGVPRGPGAVLDRLDEVTRRLSTRAADERARELEQPDEDRTVLTYLFACTRPSDRIFVFAFAPEIYYLTERGFAGGHVSFVVGYHGSDREQQLAIERWNRQSVPLALMVEDERREAERFFPRVARELARRYVAVHRIANWSGGAKPLLVMADRARTPVSTYGPLRLPCFAEKVSDRPRR